MTSRASSTVGVKRGDSRLPALTCALVSLMACQKAKADTRRASPLCDALVEPPAAQSPVASKNQFTVAHISWDAQSVLYVPQSEVYSGSLAAA